MCDARVVHALPLTWSTVSSAFWRKHPSRHCPQVQQIDAFERTLQPDGRLRVARLVQLASEPIGGVAGGWPWSGEWVAVETATVDPRARSLLVTTRNLTGRRLVDVTETCRYEASGDHTTYTHEFRVVGLGFWGQVLAAPLRAIVGASLADRSRAGVLALREACCP